MRDRGWRSYVGLVAIVEPPTDAATMRRYDDRYAYGITTDLDNDTSETVDANTPFYDHLTDAQRQQVQRDLWAPADSNPPGCVAQGTEEAFGDLDYGSDAITSIIEEVGSREAASPALGHLNEEWSSCMAKSGFRYEDPGSILSELSSDLAALGDRLGHQPRPGDAGLAELNTKEHGLYDHDQQCQQLTDYVATEQSIRYPIENEIIAEHPEIFLGGGSS